jgi:MoaA/NifB/PqqE/SkfB family radical SAM enzyme
MIMENPKQIVFFVTNRCNARCPHCFYWKSMQEPEGEMSLEEISKINFEGVKSIAVTGGEPTVRSDFAEICALLGKRTKYLTVNSNGLLPAKLRPVLMANRDITLQLSIDGTEEVHDGIRGKGTFKTLMSTLEMARELDVKTVIVTTVSKKNAEGLEDLVVFLNRNRYVFEHRFNITRGIGSSLFNLPQDLTNFHSPRDTEIMLSLPETEAVAARLRELNRRYRFWQAPNQKIMEYTIRVLKEKRKILPCYAGTEEGVIYPNGDVAFCEFTKPFANLRDFAYDLNALWNSRQADEMRKMTRACFCTHSCNLSTAIGKKHSTELLVRRALTRHMVRRVTGELKRGIGKRVRARA